VEYDEGGYEDYGGYDGGSGYENNMMEASTTDKGHLAARKVFDQHMEKSTSPNGRPCYKCTLCGKENSHLNNLRNHIESVHFPGHFSYSCHHCEKTFKTKNVLCSHISHMHKEDKL